MRHVVWLSVLGLFAALPHAAAENPALENARLHPDSFEANHLAGEYLISARNYPSAIAYLEKAWEIDPTNYINGYDLALIYFETGATQKSRDVIQSLIKREDKADLHNLLGDLEESQGHVNEAAREYETAARLDPSEKNVFDLGSDLLKHRAFAPALKVFEFGVQRYATSPRLRVGLGIADYSLGQYDAAVETLCAAVDLDPKDTKALDFLGKMYDISPQYADEVTKRLARFAGLYPANSKANYYYAVSLRKRNSGLDLKTIQLRAETYLLKAVTLEPNFADAHFELGLLYEDESRESEAIHHYRQAITIQPGLAKAHYHLARLYQKRKQPTLAQHEFYILKTLKTNPE